MRKNHKLWKNLTKNAPGYTSMQCCPGLGAAPRRGAESMMKKKMNLLTRDRAARRYRGATRRYRGATRRGAAAV